MEPILNQLRESFSGSYRIERELGRGGSATVFLAEDIKHRRRVALKVPHEHLRKRLGDEHLLHEIGLIAQLQHPHILPLLDSGRVAGHLFLVLPYVEDETLRDRLAHEPRLPAEEGLRLASEVAEALEYAHKRRIVHLDVKPENILLSDGHAVLTDFGIARDGGIGDLDTRVTTGFVIGTPGYMSPEALLGHETDGRSDIYSLGCVLYEVLAGHPPFTSDSPLGVARRHLVEDPRPITHWRPDVSRAVAKLLDECLAKEPAKRTGSAGELARRLREAAIEAHAAQGRQLDYDLAMQLMDRLEQLSQASRVGGLDFFDRVVEPIYHDAEVIAGDYFRLMNDLGQYLERTASRQAVIRWIEARRLRHLVLRDKLRVVLRHVEFEGELEAVDQMVSGIQGLMSCGSSPVLDRGEGDYFNRYGYGHHTLLDFVKGLTQPAREHPPDEISPTERVGLLAQVAGVRAQLERAWRDVVEGYASLRSPRT